jgi:hypothetical protein
MRQATAMALAAGLLMGLLATAPAGASSDAQGGRLGVEPSRAKPGDRTAMLFIAERASRRECATYLREEREARRRGDWWRADQLRDGYRSDCLKPG